MSIMKREHVRKHRANDGLDHFCHAHGCSVSVPPSIFMCRRHWAMVPTEHKKAIWGNFRPGQEKDKLPSQAYLAAAKQAIASVAAIEGVRR